MKKKCVFRDLNFTKIYTKDPHTFFPLKTKPRLNRSTNKSSLPQKKGISLVHKTNYIYTNVICYKQAIAIIDLIKLKCCKTLFTQKEKEYLNA